MSFSTALQLTLLDYLVLGAIVISAGIGLLRGLMRELFSLIGWVLAAWLAYRYGEHAAQWLPLGMPGGGLARQVAGFVLLFVATILACGLLATLLTLLLKTVGLSLADRGLGLVFGAIRGLVFVMIMVTLGSLTALPQEPFWRLAVTRPYIETAVRLAKPWLPSEFANKISFLGD